MRDHEETQSHEWERPAPPSIRPPCSERLQPAAYKPSKFWTTCGITTAPAKELCRPSRSRVMQGGSRLHVILALFLVEFALLFCGCVLILLILRDKVVHVALGLRELHLVHALARIPVQEGLAPEHRCEVLSHAFEHLLNGCRVPKERYRHFQALRRDIADRGLDVVRDPLNKIGGVLVLDVQ